LSCQTQIIGKKKMKIARKKTTASLIAIILMISTIFISTIPNAKAAEYDTFIHQTATPNPIGVGQRTQLNYMMTDYNDQRPPNQYPLESPRYGYWENVTVTIWKPNNTTETIGPIRSGEAGSGFTYYTPTTLGKYLVQWTFHGQTIEVGPDKGDYYKPSTSNKLELVVQQEPVVLQPIIPLPTDYWQYPIYGDKHNWYTIAGNWLWGDNYRPATDRSGGFNPYATAPNSAHILWSKPTMYGGILDAELGPGAAYTGRRPNAKFEPPVIIAGRLYYNEQGFGMFGNPNYNGFKCVDLYTGEIIWENIGEGLYITNGQTVSHHSTSQEGIFAYLWKTDSSPWRMWDAWTGQWILNITNVGSGTNMIGPKGEILRYQLDGSRNWLTMFNSSKLLLTQMRAIGVAIDWTPVKGIYNYSDGLQWNKTLTDVAGNPSISMIASDLQLIIASNTFPATATAPNGIRQELAYSIKPGEEGRIVWVQNRTSMFDVAQGPQIYRDGIYWKGDQATLKWSYYDAATGNYLGDTEPCDNGLAIYSMSGRSVLAYNNLSSTGYDGVVRAWNQTGDKIWQWYAGSAGFETPYGSWPLQGSYTGPKAADDKIFVANGEHTPMNELWRGGRLYAINATTGEEVWSISGTQAEASPMGVAWGTLVYLNGYDGKIYCFGKGQSSTTVSAPQTAVTLGQTIMVTGTVMDQSIGQKNTPAISDDSMSTWMEYLHMQQPIPTNATGVEVTLDVIDANGNSRNIGVVTTDTSGSFGYTWQPDIPGQYQIIATFPGSESYGSSLAKTYVAVIEATTVAPTVQPQTVLAATASDLMMYIGASTVAIVIAIAMVGVLLLRKRQ
jgi:hypothetical protein